MELQHQRHAVNGVELHCVVAGQGPLVVLLHGFPEFWYSWRKQIPALAEHFTVVAPDLRGYNLSSKPSRISNYVMPTLVEDVVQLIRALGYEQAYVVGHDWGGAVAWSLALTHPKVVAKLGILNIPHPRLFAQNILTNGKQRLRSWYMLFFQLPLLPELAFRAGNFAALENALRSMAVHKEHISADDIAAYKVAAAQPGALRAAINYYRALSRRSTQHTVTAVDPVATMPVQVIWGEQDVALGKELNINLARYVPDLRLHYIADAGHFVHQDRPDLVNQYLLEFLGTGDYVQ